MKFGVFKGFIFFFLSSWIDRVAVCENPLKGWEVIVRVRLYRWVFTDVLFNCCSRFYGSDCWNFLCQILRCARSVDCDYVAPQLPFSRYLRFSAAFVWLAGRQSTLGNPNSPFVWSPYPSIDLPMNYANWDSSSLYTDETAYSAAMNVATGIWTKIPSNFTQMYTVCQLSWMKFTSELDILYQKS